VADAAVAGLRCSDACRGRVRVGVVVDH
jgi:hypothetical protein